MPLSLRSRRPQPAQPPKVNALVAAATLVRRSQLTAALAGRTAGAGGGAAWQDLAWAHYEHCGELRFACNWLGNSLSRARLYAATQPDPEADPVPLPDTHPAAVALAALCGGRDGQAAMLQRLGTHLTIPGESFLVGWDDPESGQQEWATLCSEEIRQKTGDKVEITRLGEDYELPENALIIRIWRPHPRRHWEADSPARGLEVILNELEKLTQHVVAQAESRLAGAGLLCLPLGTVFPPPPAPPQPPGIDPDPVPATAHDQLGAFIESLTEAMVKPIEDRDDANAIVPIIIQAEGDQLEHIRHISFATPLSAEAMQLREEAIKRLATGLDMPAEVLTGMGESNHWSAWQIDESGVRIHVEPVLGLICQALTIGYLRPVLGAEADTGPHPPMIWYDAAELKQRPDRSGAAADLYDRGELSGEALRRESGFGEPDAPPEDERRERLLRGMVDRATVDAQLGVELLVLLGYLQEGDLTLAPAQGELPAADEPPPPDDEGDDVDQRALPERPDTDTPGGDDTTTPPPGASPSPGASQVAHQDGMWLAARLLARHVMTTAGRGLLAAAGRGYRNQHLATPKWELHTCLPYDQAAAERAVDHALEPFAKDFPAGLLVGVRTACRRALAARVPLRDDALAANLPSNAQPTQPTQLQHTQQLQP